MAATLSRTLSRTIRTLPAKSSRVWRQSSFIFRSFSSQQGIQLHYDWIGPSPGAQDCDHLVVFLHGLLGNGRNVRTMAKKLCNASQQPGILVDVRGHGNSQLPQAQATNFEACVHDLQQTLHSIPQVTPETNLTLVGHSLGGRISLQYAYNHAIQQQQQPAPEIYPPLPNLNRIWLLDTVPGEANDGVEQLVGAVTELSSEARITDRKKLVEQLTNGDRYKIDQGIAQWLASTLQKRRDGDGLEFGFDLAVVNDLLAHFQEQDFMYLLQEVVEADVRVDMVRGGKNKGWTEATVGPLKDLEQQYNANLALHLLPEAGHWVHVDDLPGLLEVMDVSTT